MYLINRPLVRWVVTAHHAVEIFRESVARTTATLGLQNFDWAASGDGVQNCRFLPVLYPHVQTDNLQSLWKRHRPDSHELIIDGSVILCRIPGGLFGFLEDDSRGLVSGKTHWATTRPDLVPQEAAECTTAMIGYPPGFNPGDPQTACDVLSAIATSKPYVVGDDDILPAHPNGLPYNFHGQPCFYNYCPGGGEAGWRFVHDTATQPHGLWGAYKNSVIKFL